MTSLEQATLIFLAVAVGVTGIINVLGRSFWGKDPEGLHFWRWNLFYTSFTPLLALLFVALLNWWMKPFSLPAPGIAPSYWQLRIHDAVALSAALIIAWASYRWIRIIEGKLTLIAKAKSTLWDHFFFTFVCISLRAAIPPVIVSYLLLRLEMSANIEEHLQKIPSIVLIFAIGWVLYRTAALGEEIIVQTGAKPEESLESRRVITRVRLMRQLAGVLISVLVVGALLMMFKEARSLGTSLLASAGVATVVLGLAAQKTFSTVFAGIQIALTQPIRIGDQIVVQSEFGTVEEITLTYVVVKLWDLRRMVLPINFFIEQPFENWTRTSTNVIGAVLIRVDFSAPIDLLRQRFNQIVQDSQYWNQNSCSLQVTNSDAVSLELRLTASAPTAGDSWNLRCEIREKMIDFLRRELPHCLPKGRSDSLNIHSWDESVNHPPH